MANSVPSAVFLNERDHYLMVGKGAGAARGLGTGPAEAQAVCLTFSRSGMATQSHTVNHTK